MKSSNLEWIENNDMIQTLSQHQTCIDHRFVRKWMSSRVQAFLLLELNRVHGSPVEMPISQDKRDIQRPIISWTRDISIPPKALKVLLGRINNYNVDSSTSTPYHHLNTDFLLRFSCMVTLSCWNSVSMRIRPTSSFVSNRSRRIISCATVNSSLNCWFVLEGWDYDRGTMDAVEF